MITINASGNRVSIDRNGQYRIFPSNFDGFSTISALWANEETEPAGSLRFSVDGDPGYNSNLGSMDMAKVGEAGSRVCISNSKLAFIDVGVSSLPESGKILLFLR